MVVPSGGLVRLQESMTTLPESEARIAEFILQKPMEFVSLTIQELAAKTHSSPAAAVRLWKSLGFTGYQDLKLRVAGDIQHISTTDSYSELSPDSSFSDILHNIEDTHVQSIQNTLRLIDEASVYEAAHKTLGASKILTFGVGGSAVVANDFAQKLARIGFPVYNTEEFHKAAVFAAQLGENDVMILVSHSGRTSDVVEVASIAKQRGVHSIAITRFGDTPLARVANTKLYVSAVEPQLRVAATASRVAALTVIDLLFVCLANQFPQEIYEALDTTRDVVKSHKL